MIDLLARKSAGGDVSINLAKQLISNHEWGRARMALEQALAKGGLSNPDGVHRLLKDISYRLCGDDEPRVPPGNDNGKRGSGLCT